MQPLVMNCNCSVDKESQGKTYISYDEVRQLIWHGADKIKEQFNPEVLLAIGGDGYVPARMLRPHLSDSLPILSVTVSLYGTDDVKRSDRPTVYQWLDANAIEAIRGKRVLVVDDVDDSRTTLLFVLDELAKLEAAKELGVFVLHNKTSHSVEKPPLSKGVGFYLAGSEVDAGKWLVYPWE